MRKALQRDEGLYRLSRGTRWLAAGALISAGCVSVAVAESHPGGSSAATHTGTVPSTEDPQPPATEPAGSGASGESGQPSATTPAPAPTAPTRTLSPPTAPPQTYSNPPVVSSGGS